jgi:hypothetical protein
MGPGTEGGARGACVRTWKDRADAFLADHPDCICCGGAATVADHIIPLAAGGGVDGALQPLCAWCHDNVKRRIDKMFKRGQCTLHDLRMDGPLAQQIRKTERRAMLRACRSS